MIVEVIIFVLLAVVRIDTQSDCDEGYTGPCCSGCHSYTMCTDGVGETIDCNPPDEAYNELIGGCDLRENTPPPCGNNDNCTGLPDGSYPDMTPGEECEAFFTCTSGYNRGVTPCNPPNSTDQLVFDYKLQICNWRSQVPPPCGTYGTSPLPRFKEVQLFNE